jgi:tetratricopeptide (TPR) repeat protein
VIYKGRASTAQLLNDARLLEAPAEHWRISALPFPGQFIGGPPKPQPLRVASQFVDGAEPRIALQYLQRYAATRPVGADVKQVIAVLDTELNPEPNQKDPGIELLAKADALRDSGDHAAAIAAYKAVLRQSPRTFAAAERLAWLLATSPDATLRAPAEALALASRLNQISKGENPEFLDLLGAAQAASGDFDAAQASAEAALKLIGDDPASAGIRERLTRYREGKRAD